MRELSGRERDVLVAMVERGQTFDDDAPVSADDRQRWLRQVPATRVQSRCGCGTCPTVNLTDLSGVAPGMEHSRVVLEADTDGAMLLLFVDDDRLSSLELAPFEDRVFAEFPAVDAVRFQG